MILINLWVLIIIFVCMIIIFFNFYVDEVDIDFKFISFEDEDKGSEGKKYVVMEIVCLVRIYVVWFFILWNI